MVDSFLLTGLGFGCVRAGECLRTCQPAPFVRATIGAGSSLVNEISSEGATIFSNGILWAVKLISTTEAARRLNVNAE